jgi:predicted transcriptional regulator
MSKTVVELSDEQITRLQEIAAKEGRSVSEVVRESVEAYLGSHVPIDRETLKRRFLEAAGTFHSGVPDLAVEHDKYFVEAIEET